MLTAQQIEAMREKIKPTAEGDLYLMDQNPGDNYRWSKNVVRADRDEWLELLDLAAMAARIRER